MAITLYDITVPVFLRRLAVLSDVLGKGRAFADAEGTDHAELLGARLAPDMLTLVGQVQRASDTAKFAAVRVGGVENVPLADEEKSFADLDDRIARTQAFLETVPRAAMEGDPERLVTFSLGRHGPPLEMTPREYVLGFALPNFFFHVTTAYAILRARGVPLGKKDFIGPLGRPAPPS